MEIFIFEVDQVPTSLGLLNRIVKTKLYRPFLVRYSPIDFSLLYPVTYITTEAERDIKILIKYRLNSRRNCIEFEVEVIIVYLS